MNVLIGCELSGTVRDKFEDMGWNAWSCDLFPTDSEQTKASGKHIAGDVLRLFGKRYISPDTIVDWHNFAMFGNALMAKNAANFTKELPPRWRNSGLNIF